MGSKGFYSLSFYSSTGKHSVLSWSADNRIALACDSGVYVLTIKTCPTDYTASFIVHKEFLPASKDVLAFDVGIDRELLLKNLDSAALSQLMLDRSLSPAIASTVSYRGCRRAVWSPVGGDPRGRCALAVLSHDHRLTLHTRRRFGHGWQEIISLSSRLHHVSTSSGFPHADDAKTALAAIPAFRRYERKVGRELAQDLLNLQARTYSLCADLMEWSVPIDGVDGSLLPQSWIVNSGFPHAMMETKEDGGESGGLTNRKRSVFAFFFTVMKSGHLVVWKTFLPLTSEDDCHLVLIYHTGELHPSAVSQFHPSSLGERTAMLAIGFNSGLVKLLKIDWSSPDNVVIQHIASDPWPHQDKLTVSQLLWFEDANLAVLLVLKENYIIALRISPDGVCTQQTQIGGITCLGLTGCCRLDDSVLISSADGLLLKVSLALADGSDELAIYPERVSLNCSGSDFTQSGVAASPNGIYVILAETFSLSFDHLRTRDPLRVHLLPAKTVSQAFDIMLESPRQTQPGSPSGLAEGHLLSSYLDCLECIRQGIASGDELPALLLQQVNARDRWHSFSDFHLKLTRFATDLLMAPTISKTSESVRQLQTSRRLLDNLILWRHGRRFLTTFLSGDPPAVDSVGDVAAVHLMCEWMTKVAPSLLHGPDAIAGPDDAAPDVVALARSRLATETTETTEAALKEACACVVCGLNVPLGTSDISADSSSTVTSHPTPPMVSPHCTPTISPHSTSTPTISPHSAACAAGHFVGRCCLTLLPCAEIPYRKCAVCGATSLDPLREERGRKENGAENKDGAENENGAENESGAGKKNGAKNIDGAENKDGGENKDGAGNRNYGKNKDVAKNKDGAGSKDGAGNKDGAGIKNGVQNKDGVVGFGASRSLSVYCTFCDGILVSS